MFSRKSGFAPVGRLQTSTYFVSRHLAQEVPFRAEVRPHEDFDWLLRVSTKTDAPFQVLPEVLSVYHNELEAGREGAVGSV